MDCSREEEEDDDDQNGTLSSRVDGTNVCELANTLPGSATRCRPISTMKLRHHHCHGHRRWSAAHWPGRENNECLPDGSAWFGPDRIWIESDSMLDKIGGRRWQRHDATDETQCGMPFGGNSNEESIVSSSQLCVYPFKHRSVHLADSRALFGVGCHLRARLRTSNSTSFIIRYRTQSRVHRYLFQLRFPAG